MIRFVKSYFWVPSLIALALYFQSIWFGTSCGDDWLVTSPMNKDFHLMLKTFYDNSNFPGVHFIPVYFLQCFFINSFFGEHAYPQGFHIYSVFVHLLACLIATYVMYKITSNKLVSILIVSLWTAHPLNVQIITRLGCGPAQLAGGMFCLSFILCFLKALEEKDFYRKVIFVILGSILYLCSMTTHEQPLLFPVLILLIAFYLKKEKLSRDNLYVVVCPLFLLIPMYLAWRFVACNGMLYETSNELIKWTEVGTIKDILFRAYWLAPQILVHYIRLFLWPDFLSEAKANWFYVGKTIFDPYAMFCQLLVISLIVSSVALLKKIPIYSIGVMWFLLHMILVSQIMPLFMMIDEHYSYVSSLGLYLVIFSLILKYKNIFKIKILLSLVIPIFVLLMSRTLICIPSGKDFFTRCIYCAKEAPIVNKLVYMGKALELAEKKKRTSELPSWLNEHELEILMDKWIHSLIDIKPDLSIKYGPIQVPYNFNNYSSLLRYLSGFVGQTPLIDKTVKTMLIVKSDWQGWIQLSSFFALTKRWDLAWVALKNAINKNPKHLLSYNDGFIDIAINSGNISEAEQVVQNYIGLYPELSRPYLFAGLFFFRTNRVPEAIRYFKEGVRKKASFSDVNVYILVSDLLVSVHMNEEAKQFLNVVISTLDPFNISAKNKLFKIEQEQF